MYAALKPGVFQLAEVSSAYGISRNHLAKVVHNLALLGYLETRRGRGGGIRLLKAAESIRLGELLRTTEDQPVLLECFDPVHNRCVLNGNCRLKGWLHEARTAFYASLNQHTLRDLVTGGQTNKMKSILFESTPR